MVGVRLVVVVVHRVSWALSPTPSAADLLDRVREKMHHVDQHLRLLPLLHLLDHRHRLLQLFWADLREPLERVQLLPPVVVGLHRRHLHVLLTPQEGCVQLLGRELVLPRPVRLAVLLLLPRVALAHPCGQPCRERRPVSRSVAVVLPVSVVVPRHPPLFRARQVHGRVRDDVHTSVLRP